MSDLCARGRRSIYEIATLLEVKEEQTFYGEDKKPPNNSQESSGGAWRPLRKSYSIYGRNFPACPGGAPYPLKKRR